MAENGLVMQTDGARKVLFGEIDPSLSSEDAYKLEQSQMQLIWRWLRDGDLKAKKIGKKYLIASKEVEAFAEKLSVNE
jgi:hypothetical protein